MRFPRFLLTPPGVSFSLVGKVRAVPPLSQCRAESGFRISDAHSAARSQAIAFFFVLLSVVPAWSQILTHGPVVGGVTSSEAKVFVRTSAAATVALRYGTDPNLVAFLTSDSLATDATTDFTKIVSLAGLSAETPYYMDVLVNGVSQCTVPYPTFETHPPEGASRDFKFVVLTDFVTVSKIPRAFQTFRSAAAESPAFVFIGGDFDHRNPATLADKRGMFRELYSPDTRFMDDFVR